MVKIIPTDKARQGHWGRHVLIILIVSCGPPSQSMARRMRAIRPERFRR